MRPLVVRLPATCETDPAQGVLPSERVSEIKFLMPRSGRGFGADAPVICVLAALLVGVNRQRIRSRDKGLAFLMPCDYIGSKVLKALSVFISRDSRLIKRKV